MEVVFTELLKVSTAHHLRRAAASLQSILYSSSVATMTAVSLKGRYATQYLNVFSRKLPDTILRRM